MANILPREKQIAVLGSLVEGASVRSTERMIGVSRETVLSLLVRVGHGCAALLDEKMVNLDCRRLELDEIWGYVGKKQRHIRRNDGPELGDTWTFVAIDAETKLVPCFRVGKRDGETTRAFVMDLASRLTSRVQISSDGFKPYVQEVPSVFNGDVDYATIVKEYEVEAAGPGRYSPPKVIATEKTPICGAPVEELISTSYVERQNLTMRMTMRRLTRLTNGFSKKIENHWAATSLHFAHYNFVRTHQTLRTTPAVEAGVERVLWSMDELLDAAMARVQVAA